VTCSSETSVGFQRTTRRRDSVIGIATSYGLDDRGVGVRVPVGSLLHVVQTRSVAYPAPYPMGTGSSFPGVKWPGCEAYHSPPASVDVKCGSIHPLPNTPLRYRT
jgi:hypothetical protein